MEPAFFMRSNMSFILRSWLGVRFLASFLYVFWSLRVCIFSSCWSPFITTVAFPLTAGSARIWSSYVGCGHCGWDWNKLRQQLIGAWITGSPLATCTECGFYTFSLSGFQCSYLVVGTYISTSFGGNVLLPLCSTNTLESKKYPLSTLQ